MSGCVKVFFIMFLAINSMASATVQKNGRADRLRARMMIASGKIYTGEPLFVRVSLINTSQEDVDIWTLPSVETGMVKLELKRPDSERFARITVAAIQIATSFNRIPLAPFHEVATLVAVPTRSESKSPLPLSKLFTQPGVYKLRVRISLRKGSGELLTEPVRVRATQMPAPVKEILKKVSAASYRRAPAYVQKMVSKASVESYQKEYRPFIGLINRNAIISMNADEGLKHAPQMPISPLRTKVEFGSLIKRLEGAVDHEVRSIYFDRLQEVRSRVDRVTAAFIDLTTLQALAEQEDAMPLARRVFSRADRSIVQIQSQAHVMGLDRQLDWSYGR